VLAPIGPNRLLLDTVTLGAALLTGVAAALLISQIRPTFLSPAELLSRTGIHVIGTVSMNWTRHRSAGAGAATGCFSRPWLACCWLTLASLASRLLRY
jgi:hypothetical protein